MKTFWVSIVCVFLLASPTEGEQVDLVTIPGSDTKLDVLTAAVEWEFKLLPDTKPGHLTLTRHDGGLSAEEAISYRFKSIEPYGDKGPGGYTYLRFSLTSYRFVNTKTAQAALEELFPVSDTSKHGSRCFGGGYWLQHGQWVYELGVPCLFSEANYSKLIRALDDGLALSEQADRRAIRCICGGSWQLSYSGQLNIESRI